MYHSPKSPISVPPLPVKKPEACKDIEKLREKLEICLMNESSIIICAAPFIAYKSCLHKN
jgi:hypothetical protein